MTEAPMEFPEEDLQAPLVEASNDGGERSEMAEKIRLCKEELAQKKRDLIALVENSAAQVANQDKLLGPRLSNRINDICEDIDTVGSIEEPDQLLEAAANIESELVDLHEAVVLWVKVIVRQKGGIVSDALKQQAIDYERVRLQGLTSVSELQNSLVQAGLQDVDAAALAEVRALDRKLPNLDDVADTANQLLADPEPLIETEGFGGENSNVTPKDDLPEEKDSPPAATEALSEANVAVVIEVALQLAGEEMAIVDRFLSSESGGPEARFAGLRDASQVVNQSLARLDTLRISLAQFLSEHPIATLPNQSRVVVEKFQAEAATLFQNLSDRQQALRVKIDQQLEKFKLAADKTNPGLTGAKSLEEMEDNLSQSPVSDAATRARKVATQFAGMVAGGADTVTKMFVESDVSAFVQFLLYGGDGRRGGGIDFDLSSGENAISESVFTDTLRSKQAQLGATLVEAQRELAGVGWEISEDQKAGLNRGEPEAVRQVLLQVSKNFLDDRSMSLSDREYRWGLFSRAVATKGVFKGMGKMALSGEVQILIKKEADEASREWSRYLPKTAVSAPPSAGYTQGEAGLANPNMTTVAG